MNLNKEHSAYLVTMKEYAWNKELVENKVLREGKPWLGLEVQSPWSTRLLNGEKTIETRAYPLPENMMNCPILILESPQGISKTSSIPDIVEEKGLLKIVGLVSFSENIQYSSFQRWKEDIPHHCVSEDSPYAWKVSSPPIWGWKVDKFIRFQEPMDISAAKRWFRSIFCVNG